MVFSGLFQDKFVDQVQVEGTICCIFEHTISFISYHFISLAAHLPLLFPLSFSPQVVAYLHEWTDDRGGAFVYWKDNSGKMHSVPPSPLSGSSVDGSKTVHAGGFAHCFARLLRHQHPWQRKHTWSLLICRSSTRTPTTRWCTRCALALSPTSPLHACDAACV